MAKTSIYEQEQALSVYFRDMLAEPQITTTSTKTAPPPVSDKKQHIDTLPTQRPEPEQDIQQTATETVITAAISVQPSPAPILADETIKLLMCEIGEMKLALPVAALNNIIRWPQQGLSQLPGQPSWQLGLLSQAEHHTRVIDLCRLLKSKLAPAEVQARYILLIDDRRWAIACDRIGQILSYNKTAINWRRDRTERPWFTGVISDNMHSILDIEATLQAVRN